MDINVSSDRLNILVERPDGVVTSYDSRTGEIRVGHLLLGRVKEFQRIQIFDPNELLFPMSGLVPLLGVEIHEDLNANVVAIVGDGFNLASMDPTYGGTTNGKTFVQSFGVNAEGLVGGIRTRGQFLRASDPTRQFFAVKRAAVRAENGSGSATTVGDQITPLGIDAFETILRGVRHERRVGSFQGFAYVGRSLGSTVGSPGSSFGRYDTTTFGLGLQKESGAAYWTVATNLFAGKDRSGLAAGMNYGHATAKHAFDGQILLGSFSGLSSPYVDVDGWSGPQVSNNMDEATARILPDSAGQGTLKANSSSVFPVTTQRLPVRGGAFGVTLSEAFSPVKQVTISGWIEHYSKNFLAAQENAQFNAQSSRSASLSLSPNRFVRFRTELSRSSILIGSRKVTTNHSYGVDGSLPVGYPIQLSFMKSTELGVASSTGRTSLVQYSAALPRLKTYSAHAQYTSLSVAGEKTRNLNTIVSRDLKEGGLLSVRNQIQLGDNRRIGVDWQREFSNNYSLRLGFDRSTSLSQPKASYVPVLSLRTKFSDYLLQLRYWSESNSKTLQFDLRVPLFKNRG